MTVINGDASPKFHVGQSMLVQSDKDDLFYEAKIASISEMKDEPVYTVHYVGWNKSKDEKFAESDLVERMLEATEKNKKTAKAERDAKMQEATRKEKPIKKKTPAGTPASNKRLNQSAGAKSLISAKRQKQEAPPPFLTPSVKIRITNEKILSTPKTTPTLHHVAKNPITVPELVLPEKLYDLLTVDKEHLDLGQIAKLPARFTITDIIEEYAESLHTPFKQPLDEFLPDNPLWESKEINERVAACYIRDIFDVTVMTQLLYSVERRTFEAYKEDVLKDAFRPDHDRHDQEIRLSNHLGIVHLLRCFVKLNDFMRYLPNLENYPVVKSMFIETLAPFVSYLEKKRNVYYRPDVDYDPTH